MQQTIRLPEPALGTPPGPPGSPPGPPGPRPGPETPAPWAVTPAAPYSQPGSLSTDPYAPAPSLAKNGPGAGTRVIGSVVGLLLGLLGLVGVLVGQSSPEGNQTRGLWFGVGLVLLVAVVLLGSWTAAAPITAGVVGAVPGLLGVIAPVTWKDLVGQVDLNLELAGVSGGNVVLALGTYTAAAVGVLLVVAGITTVIGRRRGAAREA